MFTLEAEKWYALEALQPIDFIGQGGRYWPAYVTQVRPRQSGQGLLEVACAVAGEQITLELTVRQRKPALLLAGFGEENAVTFRPLSWAWLKEHRPALATRVQQEKPQLYESDLAYFLDREYDQGGGKLALAQFRGRRITFRAETHWLARAVEVPLEVQAESLVELWAEVQRRVGFYLSGRAGQPLALRLALSYSELDILTAWALRFDGYRYQEAHPEQAALFMAREPIPDDPLLQLTQFFMLQRYLLKWGGDRSPAHGREWRLFRALFLQAANYDIPLAYRHPFHYRDWLLNYEPCRSQCIDVVRRVHESIPYDDDASDEAGLPELFSPFRSHTVTIAADA